MYNKLRSFLTAVAVFGALFGLVAPPAPPAWSQAYPTQTPTYIPAAVLPPQLIPTGQGSSFVFQTNGVAAMYMRIFGAPSGLSAYVQGTENRSNAGQATSVSATVTISNASPAVITWANHQLSINQPVVFTTTGGLPTGLTAGTPYYVIAAGLTSGALEVAATPGGAAINTSSAGTGTQTGTAQTPYWANLGAQQVGGPSGATVNVGQITAAGVYRISTQGLAQVRLNVASLTSGVAYVDFSAGLGEFSIDTAPRQRVSFSASATIGTGATSHFLVIAGSATKTVRVTRVSCFAQATGAIYTKVTANVNSAADTGDAGTALTAVPHDSLDPAATAVALFHTTSPTPGTAVGAVRTGILNVTLLTESATDFPTVNPPLTWEFGTRPFEQEVVLRGVAQTFSLDTSAAFGSGGNAYCDLAWTEE